MRIGRKILNGVHPFAVVSSAGASCAVSRVT
jgi:hypothetical protein